MFILITKVVGVKDLNQSSNLSMLILKMNSMFKEKIDVTFVTVIIILNLVVLFNTSK